MRAHIQEANEASHSKVCMIQLSLELSLGQASIEIIVRFWYSPTAAEELDPTEHSSDQNAQHE
jgi:hypothetical protein